MSEAGLSAGQRNCKASKAPFAGLSTLSMLMGLVASWGVAGESGAFAQEHSDEALNKQLSNPISSLISVPFQLNYDCCFGPADGERYQLNIQPVIPFSLKDDLNLVVRTITPVIYQNDVVPGDEEFGLGDITQSFFLVPKSSGDTTWGVGPVFLWPIGAGDLSGEKWGIGPTAVVLKQTGPTTVGALVNHIWSYAGDDDAPDINSTFLQPFFAYQLTPKTTLTINTESTYSWETEDWTIPINLVASHLLRFGHQPVQFSLGGRGYVQQPPGGPDWGARAVVTLLFPK